MGLLFSYMFGAAIKCMCRIKCNIYSQPWTKIHSIYTSHLIMSIRTYLCSSQFKLQHLLTGGLDKHWWEQFGRGLHLTERTKWNILFRRRIGVGEYDSVTYYQHFFSGKLPSDTDCPNLLGKRNSEILIFQSNNLKLKQTQIANIDVWRDPSKNFSTFAVLKIVMYLQTYDFACKAQAQQR